MDQLTVHKKIDELVEAGADVAAADSIHKLTDINIDAKKYFFAKINESWFDFLVENNFLNPIKSRPGEGERWRNPELTYLNKVGEKIPHKITDLILDSGDIDEQFNIDTLDTFLRLAGSLPAEELLRIVPKIHKENWVKLMHKNDAWGFEYENILKTLAENEKYSQLIQISEVVLSIRTKDELGSNKSENPFYLSDLQHSNVLEYLSQLPPEHLESGLKILINTLSRIVVTGEKETNRESAFKIQETYHLFDVDFFTTKLGNKKHISYRDDVRDLAALISELTKKLIESNCDDDTFVREIYTSLFSNLPDARTMWRLKLYVLSLCPNTFSEELSAAYNEIFKHDDISTIYDLVGGAEYQHALRAGFAYMSPEMQRKFVANVFVHFDREGEDKSRYERYAQNILSMIKESMTSEEIAQTKSKEWTLHDNEPTPSIGPVISYDAKRTGPVTETQLGELTIPKLIEKLKTEWTAEHIDVESFHGPSMEGAGELIREDVPNRPTEYIENLNNFFDREGIGSNYTYDVLRGVENSIREGKLSKSDTLPHLLQLGLSLKQSAAEQPFEERQKDENGGRWLAGWTAVHDAYADILIKVLEQEEEESKIPFATIRKNLLAVIEYLLSHQDPKHEDEINAGENDLVAEPFGSAINSVRGRAFQSFIMFIQYDSLNQPEDQRKINDDVRNIYSALLQREDTYALYFMFGHYLPTCYFRDKEWVNTILTEIFPTDPDKHDYYISSLDGFLTNNLYGELMSEHPEIYDRAISLTSEQYTKRRFGRELDETIATHIALAYLHFDEFSLNHVLVAKFWKDVNTERAKSFISFVGRHAVGGDSAVNIRTQKIEELWDFILENCSDEEALMEFGFWVRYEDPILLEDTWTIKQLNKTLEKTGGIVSWEHGIVESLPRFAKVDPKGTLDLISQMLLGPNAKSQKNPWQLHVNRETKDALQRIYTHKELQPKVYELINQLLPLANGEFWTLKDIVEEKLD